METRDEDAMLESWLVRISGRVQGVGYRQACVARAQALGITGWVRNRADGSVEATLQGSPPHLAVMCGWLRTGVPFASVEHLAVTPLAPPVPRFARFERFATL